jgi:hypothetical protein
MMLNPEDDSILSLHSQQILARAWQRSIPNKLWDDQTMLLYLLGALPEAECGELEESITHHTRERQKLLEISTLIDSWQRRPLSSLVIEAGTNALIRLYLQHLVGQLVREADTNLHRWVHNLRKEIWQEFVQAPNLALARNESSIATLPDATGLWTAPLRLPDTSLKTIDLGPLILQEEGFTLGITLPKSLLETFNDHKICVELTMSSFYSQTLAVLRINDISKNLYISFPQTESIYDPNIIAALIKITITLD